MKMSKSNFKQFDILLKDFLARHPEFVRADGWSDERWRWEVYHACNEQHLPKAFTLRPLTEGLNDNHIDTALRKVFAE